MKGVYSWKNLKLKNNSDPSNLYLRENQFLHQKYPRLQGYFWSINNLWS